MQQQSIIISAIALAVILAGVLWYALTQTPSSDIALASPFPTPTATTGALPPSAVVLNNDSTNTTASVAGEVDLATLTPTPLTVPPTAYTGPTEIVLGILFGSTLVGLWGLYEAKREFSRRQLNV